MHILIVSQYFWPESFSINQLAESLVEQGNQVTVLTAIPNYPQGQFYKNYGWFKPFREQWKGINIIRAPIISRGKSKGLRLVVNYVSYVLSACLLVPFLCRKKYDVIYVYGVSPITQVLPAMLVKCFKKTPIILNVQDLWPESLSATGVVNHDSWVIKIVGKLVRFIYKHCDKILVQSKGFIDSVKSYGASPDKIIYFPNAAPDLYQPVATSTNLSEKLLLPKGFVVLFAGNIGVAQDFPTVLAAAKQLQECANIQFVIVGDGRNKDYVAEQIQQKGLEKTVHLIGRFPETQMPNFFALADVLLVSLADQAIFALTIPSKVQSYLACGKPIVAALNGEGAKVIREADAGLTVNAGDAMGLASAILSLYNRPKEELIKLGEKGLQYSKKYFNRQDLMKQLLSIMREVVK